MFVAAWSLDVQFASAAEALRAIKEFAAQDLKLWRTKGSRILLGAIGVPESRIVVEYEFETLADLEATWNALHARGPEIFRAWLERMQPHVVAGSPRWEVYRVV